MKYLKETSLILLTSLVVSLSLKAQNFIWKIGYFGFMDNREYYNKYVNDQTIFGSRISGALGFSINDNNMIMAGIDFLYEFGSKGNLQVPDMILYYNGRRKNLDFYLGAFPRNHNLNMPMALMIDTFQYFRPNVEGSLLSFKSSSFSHNIWIDWTGRQSYNRREAFLVGFSGYYKKKMFLYCHHFIMSHLAHSMQNIPEEHIRDNGAYSVMLGLDFKSLIHIDSLSLYAGFLGSYDRIRGIYDFRLPFGWISELDAEYKGFGLHATLYSGESQSIISGDGFYKSTFYTRTDAFYMLTSSNIQGKLQFSFHFLPDVVDLSMSLVIHAQLDGLFRSHHPN
jgi:hypothetical protein